MAKDITLPENLSNMGRGYTEWLYITIGLKLASNTHEYSTYMGSYFHDCTNPRTKFVIL